MTRSARFVAECALAAVASGFVAVAVSTTATPATAFSVPAAARWIVQLTELYLEWLVMRRYFGWASQWTLATLAGEMLAGAATPLMTWLRPLVGFRLSWFPVRMLMAVPQAIVLNSRARMPWLWPVIQAVLGVAVLYASQALCSGSVQTPTLAGSVVTRGVAIVGAVAGAAVLAWMCRDELESSTERPPAETSTRLEFLIGWVAVHAAVVSIVAATPAQSSGPVSGIRLAIVVYAVAFLAGLAFVLSTTKEDWKAWGVAPTIVAGGWIVASLTPLLSLVYYAMLLTKWTALGLTLACAQWFAIKRWSPGAWWLAAAVVGWSASLWIPKAVAAMVGPGQLYRYQIAEPGGLYMVAGLLTGLALIRELRRGNVFAS